MISGRYRLQIQTGLVTCQVLASPRASRLPRVGAVVYGLASEPPRLLQVEAMSGAVESGALAAASLE
jgi:hypothetical protein